MLENVLSFIQSRFSGEDVNDILQAARHVVVYIYSSSSYFEYCENIC